MSRERFQKFGKPYCQCERDFTCRDCLNNVVYHFTPTPALQQVAQAIERDKKLFLDKRHTTR